VPGIDSKQATAVGIVSGFSAASGFFILLVAARALSGPANAEFLAFWAALFAVYGVLSGVTAETTRAIGRRRMKPAAPPGGSIAMNALISGSVLAGLIAAVSISSSIGSATHQWPIVAILIFTSLAFSMQGGLAGALQATDQWGPYSLLVLMEAVFRLGAIAVAAGVGLGLLGLETATLAALLACPLLLACSSVARQCIRAHADVPLRALLRRTAQSCASAAASAALVVSYPLLVKVTTAPEEFALSAPVLLAISLTRAPIMLPLVAFQGAIINMVLRADNGEGWRKLSRPILGVILLGFGGAALAWSLGPWFMTLLGGDYRIQGWVLAALTLSAAGVAVLTLLGMALLAMGRHRSYMFGWIAASLSAFLLLMLPYSTEIRCSVSLLAGPLVGIAIHLYALTSVPAGFCGDRSRGA